MTLTLTFNFLISKVVLVLNRETFPPRDRVEFQERFVVQLEVK